MLESWEENTAKSLILSWPLLSSRTMMGGSPPRRDEGRDEAGGPSDVEQGRKKVRGPFSRMMGP